MGDVVREVKIIGSDPVRLMFPLHLMLVKVSDWSQATLVFDLSANERTGSGLLQGRVGHLRLR
jgi:hypothetical protein